MEYLFLVYPWFRCKPFLVRVFLSSPEKKTRYRRRAAAPCPDPLPGLSDYKCNLDMYSIKHFDTFVIIF